MPWQDKAVPVGGGWQSKAQPLEEDDTLSTKPTEDLSMFYGTEAAKVTGFGPGLEALAYTEAAGRALTPEPKEEKRDGFIKRFGKGLWNSVVALPAYAIKTESNVGKAQAELHSLAALEKDFRKRAFSGQPVTKEEVEWYASPTSKDGKAVERPFWANTVWLNFNNGNLNIGELTSEEATERLTQALEAGKIKQSEVSDISAKVSEAQGVKDSAADILSGITGFAARLAALKTAFPDLHPSLLWEVENEVSGGTPGKGLLTYGLFNAPGKAVPGKTMAAKVGKAGAESALLGGFSALESKIETGEVDWGQVATSAGIPLALRSLGYVKEQIRKGNSKVLKVAKELSEKKPGVDAPAAFKSTVEDANTNLLEWAKNVKQVLLPERKKMVKKLHAQQAAGAENMRNEYKKAHPNATAEEVNRAMKMGMSGKAEAPAFDSPKLTPGQWNSYSEKIAQAYAKNPFKRVSAQDTLDGMRYGKRLPQPHEWAELEPIFGTEATVSMYNHLARKHSFGLWDAPRLVFQGLKSMFNWDPQALRQFSQLKEQFPSEYVEAGKVNVQAYLSAKKAAELTAKLEGSQGFKLAQERGINLLGMKPWELGGKGKQLHQFQGGFTDFLLSRKSRLFKAWGRAMAASERGANVGINAGLSRMAEAANKEIEALRVKDNLTPAQVDKLWKSRANTINAFAKRVEAKNPSARQVQNAANWFLFSPAYTASRPYGSYLAIKNLFFGPKGNRTFGATILVKNIASLWAMSTIVSMVGNKMRMADPSKEPKIQSSSDPTNALWGKGRVGNNVIDFSGGDAAWYRLLARIGVSAYAYAKSKQTGTPVTKVAGTPVREPGEEIMNYITSRETVAIGLAKTLLTGKDWLGNPIPRSEAILKQIPMQPLLAVVEAGAADGMWDAMLGGDISEGVEKLLRNAPVGAAGLVGFGVNSYKVPAANTRSKFKDIVSDETYQKSWDELTPQQQRYISLKYKTQLKKLDDQVAKERIDNPTDVNKLIEEEKEIGNEIRQSLSPEDQMKVEGISLNLSRRQEDFFMNDERFGRYINLYKENLVKNLARFPSPKKELVDVLVESSKSKAWITLKKEMKNEQ